MPSMSGTVAGLNSVALLVQGVTDAAENHTRALIVTTGY